MWFFKSKDKPKPEPEMMGAIFDHDAINLLWELEDKFTKAMSAHPAITKNNEERPGGIKIRRQDVLIAADAAADQIKRFVAEEREKFAGTGQTEQVKTPADKDTP